MTAVVIPQQALFVALFYLAVIYIYYEMQTNLELFQINHIILLCHNN